jgi:hypothetical protein
MPPKGCGLPRRQLAGTARQVSPALAPVPQRGESIQGKENVVKTRHGQSRRADRPHGSLEHYVDRPFCTSDQVLLCSFGVDLAAERSTRQLRRALVEAGFLGPATGHLIRVSPLLDRSSRRRYRIREFQP